MQKVTIHKGFHRPLTLIPAGLHYISRINRTKKQAIIVIVVFTDSCRYYLNNADQQDWNKLIGICFGIRGIDEDSARFAWRYNPGTDRIEIATYYYIKGQREWEKVATVQIGETVKFEIEREGNQVWFYMNDEFMDYNNSFDISKCRFTFGCGLYFGGNKKAPQNITLKIEKVKTRSYGKKQ